MCAVIPNRGDLLRYGCIRMGRANWNPLRTDGALYRETREATGVGSAESVVGADSCHAWARSAFANRLACTACFQAAKAGLSRLSRRRSVEPKPHPSPIAILVLCVGTILTRGDPRLQLSALCFMQECETHPYRAVADVPLFCLPMSPIRCPVQRGNRIRRSGYGVAFNALHDVALSRLSLDSANASGNFGQAISRRLLQGSPDTATAHFCAP